MRLAQKHMILLLIAVLVISISALFAASVEATYEEQLDTTIYNSSHFGIESAGYAVALHVGKLTINTIGGGFPPYLINLRMDRSGNFGGGKEYKLESTEDINWMDEFGAQLVAKVNVSSTRTRVKTLNWATGEDPLLDNWDLFYIEYPFVIDFYLGIRNIHNATQADGVGFQFEDDDGPNLGNFRLAYQNGWGWNSREVFLPPTALPFFTTNYNEDSSNYLNGNTFNTTVYVSLSIEQASNEKSIDLVDASGFSKAKVGQVRLTLSGYNSGSTPGVSITFTDGNGSTNTDFRLRHDEIPSFIPFSLYLGGSKVHNGVPIPWTDLVFGDSNLKALEVGNINYENAVSRMGGDYADTITVNILSLDSNMIGD